MEVVLMNANYHQLITCQEEVQITIYRDVIVLQIIGVVMVHAVNFHYDVAV